MPVPAEYVGRPFRVLTRKLVVAKDDGTSRGQRELLRPIDSEKRPTDTEENPVLVTFEADDKVHVPSLLAIGAIAPWEPPAAPAVDEKPETPAPRRRRSGGEGDGG